MFANCKNCPTVKSATNLIARRWPDRVGVGVVVGGAGAFGVALASPHSCVQLVDDQVDTSKVFSILDKVAWLKAVPVGIVIKEVGMKASTILLHTALEANTLAMLCRCIIAVECQQ